MEHTVKKSRKNRIAMRFTACVFIFIALARLLYVMMSKEQKSVIFTVILCTGCLGYGVMLLCQTLKAQAYDITYVFGDKTLTLKLHRKELKIKYNEINDLGYVIPNENLDYSLVQIYIGKEQYVIPFMGNSQIGKGLYEMLKLKREELSKETEDGEK